MLRVIEVPVIDQENEQEEQQDVVMEEHGMNGVVRRFNPVSVPDFIEPTFVRRVVTEQEAIEMVNTLNSKGGNKYPIELQYVEDDMEGDVNVIMFQVMASKEHFGILGKLVKYCVVNLPRDLIFQIAAYGFK